VVSNALQSTATSGTWACLSFDLPFASYAAVDNNVCGYVTGAGREWEQGSGALASWRAASGFDFASQAAAPGFAAPSGPTYDLSSGSTSAPMVGAGHATQSSPTEVLGGPRGSPPDAGAYQRGAGLPVLQIDDPSVVEGHSGATLLAFTVMLSAVSANPVSVSYATTGGTANAGTDYVSATGTVTVPAGLVARSFVVRVLGDVVAEPGESIVVTLSGIANAVLARTTATGTIVDDDPAAPATARAMDRLFHPGTNEHLYTTDTVEYGALGTQGWQQEGIAYFVFEGTGSYGGTYTIPLFRLYHRGIQQHLWTTDAVEVAVLIGDPAWSYEGIPGYLVPTAVAGTTPLYRMSYPSPSLHLWTRDFTEYTVLATQGWMQEGAIGHVLQ
jgi:hypothetical protein